MDDSYSIESLLILARQYQNNTTLLGRDITDAQLTAVHSRLTAAAGSISRDERLEILRTILGYDRPLSTSKDLTMADGFGVIKLDDQDWETLVLWARMSIEQAVLI